jgi:hypothetical protein
MQEENPSRFTKTSFSYCHFEPFLPQELSLQSVRFVFMLFTDNFTVYEIMSLIWRIEASSHQVRNLNLSRFVGQVSQCFVAMRYLWGSMKNVVQSIKK